MERYSWIQLLGLRFFALGRQIRGLTQFTGTISLQILSSMTQPSLWDRELFRRHFNNYGPRSMYLLTTSSLLVGSFLTIFVGSQLLRYNAVLYLPKAMNIIITRIAVPALTNIILLFRAVMVMSFKPTLHFHGYDPKETIAHVTAFVIVSPMLYLWCLVLNLIGSVLVMPALNISIYNHFWRMRDAIVFTDISKGLIKSSVFALVIALTTLRYQANPYNNVSKSIANMIINGIFWMFLCNTLLEYLFNLYTN